MSKRTIETGHKVEVIDGEYSGHVGIVKHVYKSRGEATVYAVQFEGERSPLSFLDGELASLEASR